MSGRYQNYQHLVRLAVLFGIGVVIFFVAKVMFTPPDFGKYGHYRPGALQDVRMHPVKYAGQQACVQCHTDVAETRAGGKHARVGCESCHGPLAAHAADPGSVPGVKPDPRAICLRCHVANASKPTFMPQIVPADHAPDGACTECHQPHSPGI